VSPAAKKTARAGETEEEKLGQGEGGKLKHCLRTLGGLFHGKNPARAGEGTLIRGVRNGRAQQETIDYEHRREERRLVPTKGGRRGGGNELENLSGHLL